MVKNHESQSYSLAPFLFWGVGSFAAVNLGGIGFQRLGPSWTFVIGAGVNAICMLNYIVANWHLRKDGKDGKDGKDKEDRKGNDVERNDMIV